MATWPDYATITADGFSASKDFGTIRSSMAGGLPKQRRRWTNPIVTWDITFILSSMDDKDSFDTWFEDTVGVVGWFDVTLMGKTVSARIVNGQIAWNTPVSATWQGKCKMEFIPT